MIVSSLFSSTLTKHCTQNASPTMRPSQLLLFVAASTVQAQLRPNNETICDFYSKLLLGASNATTQLTLLTLLVNTAVIGNYTQPNHNAVPGILAKDATFNGTKVNLVPYFSGALKSTNVGKDHGVAVNFLDGGGAAPLAESKPANSLASHQGYDPYISPCLTCTDKTKHPPHKAVLLLRRPARLLRHRQRRLPGLQRRDVHVHHPQVHGSR